jgi:DNA-binding beta-propeller fold protein YncE
VRRFAIAALVAVALDACSGAGSTFVPSAPQHPSKRTVLAHLVIEVPPRRHVRERHAHYISPSTATLAYSIDGVTETPVSISTSNPNCAVNGPIGYLQCSVNLSLLPGGHVLSFTTKDAGGNVLSSNTQVASIVKVGTANTISVTLGGVAASFAVFPPVAPQVAVLAGGGFAIYGKKPLTFSIVPRDIDGNAILGPGAPQPVVAAAPAGMTMQTPPPAAPNLWTFASTYVPADPTVAKISSIAVAATPVPNSGGTVLSATIPLSLYVPWVYASTEASGDAIAVTDEFGNTQSVSGTFPNLSSVNGIAYDPHNGLLYVENGGTNAITVYDVQGHQRTVSGTFQDAGPDAPVGIVFDPHNNMLYATYATANSVAAFDEQGHLQATSGSFPNLTQPVGIAYDAADQELFVTSLGGRVTAYDEQGNPMTLSAGAFPNVNAPGGVAYDPIGALLYVANTAFVGGTGGVTVYDVKGSQIIVSGSFGGLGPTPTSIAYDAHNDWFYVGDCSSMTPTPIRVFAANGDAESVSGTFATRVPGITIVP